jgi:hypothetical protein
MALCGQIAKGKETARHKEGGVERGRRSCTTNNFKRNREINPGDKTASGFKLKPRRLYAL